MLSISAPSKFVLTLNSVPPFFVECALAFVLVILLAIPLIARVRMILENPINYFGQIAPPKLTSKSTNETHNQSPTIHHPVMSPSPVISVNLQLDTIRPIKPSSSTINRNISSNFDVELIHANYNAIANFVDKNQHNQNENNSLINIPDYDYYRHKFIELNLKRQFGECIPSNVVLNSQHLNAIDSKMIVKVKRKFGNDLFDFIESPVDEGKQGEKVHIDPTDIFLVKTTGKKEETIDRCVETTPTTPPSDPDHLPELIPFRPRSVTPTLKHRKIALSTSETQPKPPSPKKLPVTSSHPIAPQKPPKNAPLKRKTGPRPREPIRQAVPEKIPEPEKNEKSSITCPSVVSSEAVSLASTTSRPPEHSRPASSCGSRGFRAFRPRVNSRPRSGGCFGWDIPDLDSRPHSAVSELRPESVPESLDPTVDSIVDFCEVSMVDTEADLKKMKNEEKGHRSRLPVRQAEKLRLAAKEKKRVKTGEMGSQVEHQELKALHIDHRDQGGVQGRVQDGAQGGFEEKFEKGNDGEIINSKMEDKKMVDYDQMGNSRTEHAALNLENKIHSSGVSHQDSETSEFIENNPRVDSAK